MFKSSREQNAGVAGRTLGVAGIYVCTPQPAWLVGENKKTPIPTIDQAEKLVTHTEGFTLKQRVERSLIIEVNSAAAEMLPRVLHGWATRPARPPHFARGAYVIA